MPKAILITGDFITDEHVYEGSRFEFNDRSRGVRRVPEKGGAALVSRLLKSLKVKPQPPGAPPLPEDEKLGGWAIVCDKIAEARADEVDSYALWSPMPSDAAEDKRFWRCKNRMGFGDRKKKDDTVEDSGVRLDDAPKTEVIVISEGGEGFRGNEQLWRRIPFANAEAIILKTAAPPVENPLLRHLSESVKEKLIVLITADQLRKSGARISEGLSWETTFKDLLRETSPKGHLSDLAKCRHLIVTFGSEGAAWFNIANKEVCFVYKARLIENDHQASTKGTAFGFLTCVASAVTREAIGTALNLDNVDFTSALQGGLAAMQDLREHGHGPAFSVPNGFPTDRLAEVIKKPDLSFTTVRHSVAQAIQVLNKPGGSFLSLVAASKNREAVDEAMEFGRLIALHGPIALANLPHLSAGKLITAEKSDVEALRTIAQTLRRYDKAVAVKRPLSIGVFGPPGAGKSFSVKEVAESLIGDQGVWMEFNLSQFASSDDLNGAFHQVRDMVLQGKMPIVFFDEFDSQKYQWLQYLLAPMQDGRFQQGQVTHSLGKCVFIFAGGTSWTFESFGPPDESSEASEFRAAKGPDFKSRLDAFINVVGPNQRPKCAPKGTPKKQIHNISGHDLVEDKEDFWFPIRRALIIRGELGVGPDEQIEIDEGLLNALLGVDRFTNGSRSLTKIIAPLGATVREGVRPSQLLPLAQLNMQCKGQAFLDLMDANSGGIKPTDVLAEEDVRRIAGVIHETYRRLGKAAGWLKKEDDIDLDKLLDTNRFKGESNFAAAKRMPSILALVGLKLEVGNNTPEEELTIRQEIDYHLDLMANAEHQGWMNWHLQNDWSYGPKRDDVARLHPCLRPFSKLSVEEQNKDRESVRHYPDFARQAGFKIVFAK